MSGLINAYCSVATHNVAFSLSGPEIHCGIAGIAHNIIDSRKLSSYNAGDSRKQLQRCVVLSERLYGS